MLWNVAGMGGGDMKKGGGGGGGDQKKVSLQPRTPPQIRLCSLRCLAVIALLRHALTCLVHPSATCGLHCWSLEHRL